LTWYRGTGLILVPPAQEEVEVSDDITPACPRHLTAQSARWRQPPGDRPAGTAARLIVGLALVGDVAYGHWARGFHPAAWALGLIGFPSHMLTDPGYLLP
jgi:hypothetical protein